MTSGHSHLPAKKTKVVCTIGPACRDQATLEQLIRSGMNVARINFAHGDLAGHEQTLANIRAASAAVGRRVAILGDLPGPKMRIGKLAEETVQLQQGQRFVLQVDEMLGNAQRVSVSFAELPESVNPGDRIFLNDGFIQLRVEQVRAGEVECLVMIGGELRSNKGINLPGIHLGISAFTEQDHEFLRFAAQQRLDAISQSFVERGSDITTVRTMAAHFGYKPMIVAKIERTAAVTNIDDILAAADGLMVARGDLGVETPIEEIAVVQKRLIRKANIAGKPVITATQMLESMVDNPRPTRAEATDVANAILDGTDCVMLSEETAVGKYPVETVAVMSRIAQAIEPQLAAVDHVFQALQEAGRSGRISTEDLLSLSTIQSVQTLRAGAVVVPTVSGITARRLTRFRLPTWIIAVSEHDATCQQLQFAYGVYAIHEPARPPSWTAYARDWLEAEGMTRSRALVVQSTSPAHPEGTNRLEIIEFV